MRSIRPALFVLLLGWAGAAPAQRFAEITAAGPFDWLHGIVFRMQVGPLTGGDWVDLAPVDWDRDGQVDLFTGSGYGDLLFFHRAANGVLDPPGGLGSSETDPFAFNPVRAQACPEACDWDGDTDLDLLLAAGGKVFYYETRASEAGVTFAPGVELLVEGAGPLLPAPDCAIAAETLPGGDLPHLFVSCTDGRVLLARRKSEALLAPPEELVPAGDLPRARTDVADFNGDGALDLTIGTADGRAFMRFGEAKEGAMAFGERFPLGTEDGVVPGPGGVTLRDLSPRCTDWDGDGDVDILLGCRSGHVLLLERTGAEELAARDYVQQTNAPIDAGRCATADIGDWDGDGKLDLVLGREDGLLQVHLDEGGARRGVFGAGRIVSARGKPWQAEGGYSYPAFVPNTGEPFTSVAVGGGSEVQLLTRSPEGITHAEQLTAGGRALSLPGLMTVCATDYDRDGDTDFFLGARDRPGGPLGARQPVIYLENRAGLGRAPRFNKAAQIELYTSGPKGDSPLEEAGPLRPNAVSVIEWLPDENPEFVVTGARGVDLFTTPSKRNVYATLFLAPGEGSHLLPPVYFARATRFFGNPGILVGTEAYGIVCWYPRVAWQDLDGPG